jgi:hypothetical protein
LLRAVGAGLGYGGFGLNGLLIDGRLGLFSGSAEIANDRAGMARPDIQLLSERVGAFRGLPPYPEAFPDVNWGSALAPALANGAYTVHTSSYDGGEGISLFEVYDAAEIPNIPFVRNVSLRGRTAPGEDTMVGGFIIDGNGPATIVIRVVGPELSAYGVPDVLADPQLRLFAGTQTIAFNEDWESDAPANVQNFIHGQETTGAFPLDPGSASAGLVITLEPGPYTIHAASADGAAGEVLMEIYVVDL